MVASKKLIKKNKKRFKELLQKKKSDLEKTLFKDIRGSIRATIESDKNEIKDIGIIVCAFFIRKAPYDFIRTEPLFSFKEKNFDIMLFGSKTKTIVLISVKDSLISTPLSKIKELKEYSELIEKNVEIKNTIKNTKMKILDYFESIVKDKIDFKDYVLASQLVDQDRVKREAQKISYDFCLWQLMEKNTRLHIIFIPVIGTDERFIGHKDKDLRKYLTKLGKSHGGTYNDPLTFIYSASRYLKAIAISIPLFNRAGNDFDYEKWCQIFKTDLINWHDKEKQIVYKNYINYGIKCNFIKCKTNHNDILLNCYSIKSKYSKTSLLENDIIVKMVKCESNEEIIKQLPQIKKEITSQLLVEQAKKNGIKPLEIK